MALVIEPRKRTSKTLTKEDKSKYGSYLTIKEQSGKSSAAYCMNVYIKRRDLGISRPHLFNKPEFTIYPLPPGFNGENQIRYEFRKSVD